MNGVKMAETLIKGNYCKATILPYKSRMYWKALYLSLFKSNLSIPMERRLRWFGYVPDINYLRSKLILERVSQKTCGTVYL